MASSVQQQNVIDTNGRALIKYLVIGDGTNEANTVILDPAKLAFAMNANNKLIGAGTDRRSSYKYTIRRVYGNGKISGYIKLGFAGDANADSLIITSGQFDYGAGIMGDGMSITQSGANSKGNLVMTVVGAGANDAMTLFIDIKKDASDFNNGALRDPSAFNQ